MKEGGVLNLLNKLQSLDIKKLSDQAINETTKQFNDANREQLYDGLRNDGSEIEPEYSELTIEIKESKGQPTDRVTLKDTGEWWSKITTEAKNGKVITNDTDEKTGEIIKKYGRKVLGIGGQYKSLYIANTLTYRFRAIMRKATGLNK